MPPDMERHQMPTGMSQKQPLPALVLLLAMLAYYHKWRLKERTKGTKRLNYTSALLYGLNRYDPYNWFSSTEVKDYKSGIV